MTDVATETLPVLDLTMLDRGEQDAARFRDALRAATHEVGFFYLVGHGIPDDVTARAFAEAQRFFALPDEDKAQVAMRHSPHFRGWNRTGGELTQGDRQDRPLVVLDPAADDHYQGDDHVQPPAVGLLP